MASENETAQIILRRLDVQLLMAASYNTTYERLFGTISQSYAAKIVSAGEAAEADTTPVQQQAIEEEG